MAGDNGAGHADDDEDPIGSNAFVMVMLRNLTEALHKLHTVTRDQLEVLRDIRDELAHARARKP